MINYVAVKSILKRELCTVNDIAGYRKLVRMQTTENPNN